MSLFKKRGFVDKIIDKRIGLIFLRIGYDKSVSIVTLDSKASYDVIVELKEAYCDKLLSKIEVKGIVFNESEHFNRSILRSKHFPVWVDSKKIYWLSPPTDVDRDNKLKEILN